MTRARRAKRTAKASAAGDEAPNRTPSPAAVPEPGGVPPPSRRAVFIDVENTSSKAELLAALDGLALGADGARVEISAIGNWRVVGQDLARALAERGAHLVHSAPVSRVSDWSDLWIAVSAGIWLGTARPGDVIEIVSHDRAFDAVGDAAARLGVTFRRVTYRGTGSASSRRRGGRAEKRAEKQSATAKPAPMPAPPADAGDDPVAASADQLRQTIATLMESGRREGVTLDTLTRALKESGFQRPPGSPRLINRLRRLKDIEVTREGRVQLTGASAPAAGDENPDAAAPARRRRSSRRRGGRRRGRRGKGTAAGS